VGVKLARFSDAYDLVGVGDRGGPVEALVEHIAHEGSRHCVVATYAHVNVLNELATLGDGDASLQDARRLVQLTIDYSE
jgi:hypothetical protein